MIKEIVIKYEKEEGQDEEEFLKDIFAMHSVKTYINAIHKIRNELRAFLKYQELTDIEYNTVDKLQLKLWEITSNLPDIC